MESATSQDRTATNRGMPKRQRPTATPPFYAIDLDAAPESRWNEVVDAHGAALRRFITQLKESCGDGGDAGAAAFLGKVAHALFNQLDTLGGGYLAAEMRGVASRSGIPLHDIAFANLCETERDRETACNTCS